MHISFIHPLPSLPFYHIIFSSHLVRKRIIKRQMLSQSRPSRPALPYLCAFKNPLGQLRIHYPAHNQPPNTPVPDLIDAGSGFPADADTNYSCSRSR